jgi:YebC/PmpR family DNA-binding regulatory protein
LAGHSKWANIKRRKGAQDAVRGKLFTKLIKEISVAAKMGGADLDGNPRLRLAVDKARSQSMPKNTIERAIAKASGEVGGENFEQLVYEGYGTGGVAVLVEALTDNRNRTSSEIRHAFAKLGGNLGASGSVAYIFQQKGMFTIDKDEVDEDTLLMAVLDGGGDDVTLEEDVWTVTCELEYYDQCKRAIEALDVPLKTSELTRIPDTTIELGLEDGKILIKMLEMLDSLDDVQETYTNADFSEEVAAQLA